MLAVSIIRNLRPAVFRPVAALVLLSIVLSLFGAVRPAAAQEPSNNLMPADCVAGKNVPNDFFSDVLVQIGATSSDFGINAFLAWKPHEGTNACWNPLATTWDLAGDLDTCFNSVCVRNYPDRAAGVSATAKTLLQSYYPAIVRFLKGEAFDKTQIISNLSSWTGSNGYGSALANEWEAIWNSRGGTSCPSISAWKGEYFSNPNLNGNPVLCRNDGEINFDWGGNSPGAGVPADNFSARWTRSVDFSGGTYRIRMTGDDGIRLFIDNALVRTEWRPQGATEFVFEQYISAGSHTLRFEYYEQGGGAVARLRWEGPLGSGGGSPSCPSISAWKGEYFSNINLSGSPALCRNDAEINFTWGDGGPGGGVPNDNFSARWTRVMGFAGGTYRFHMTGDDGIRLFIDDVLVRTEWRPQGSTEFVFNQTVPAGNHTIRFEYYEQGGGAVAKLWWEGPLNSGASCPSISAWKGEYFSNTSLSGSPTLCRNDGEINFTWGDGGPGSGVPNDNFSARWTRPWNFAGGTYRFHMTGDDGVRLYIDDVLVRTEWRPQGATEFVFDVAIGAGSHNMRFEYYEQGGGAVAKLWWEGPLGSGGGSSSCPSISAWKGEYFSNISLSGSPTLCRNDGDINFTWGDGGPGGSVPNDNFSARWTRSWNFAGGTYRFHMTGDDGVRLYLDDVLIRTEWRPQGSTEFVFDQNIGAGNHSVRFEYYEQGGGAVAKLWWEGPLNTSCSDNAEFAGQSNYLTVNPGESFGIYFDTRNNGSCTWRRGDNYYLAFTSGASMGAATRQELSADVGAGSTYRWNIGGMTAPSTPGTYQTWWRVTHNGTSYGPWMYIEVTVRSGSTSSGNLALNRSASATSQESSSYTPNRANDGSMSTRWSSAINTNLGAQWYFIDLGSAQTFTRFVVRWEAAYAAHFFVGWSDDAQNYTGYWQSMGSQQDVTVNVGTQTHRYVAIYMDQRAPRMNNYSLYEFEVYRVSGATSMQAAEANAAAPQVVVKEVSP